MVEAQSYQNLHLIFPCLRTSASSSNSRLGYSPNFSLESTTWSPLGEGSLSNVWALPLLCTTICHFPKNCPLYPHHVLFGLCEAHSSHEHMVFKPGLGSVLFCLLNHVFGRYQSLLHHYRRLLSFNSYPLKATSGSFPALTPYLSFYCLPVFNLSSVCLPRRGIWYTMRLLALELNIIIGTEHLSYGMFIIEFHMKI